MVDAQSGSEQPSLDTIDSEEEVTDIPSCRNLFPLPQVQRPPQRRAQEGEPLIDYSKSILMTSEDYIVAMAAKATRKQTVAKEREERKKQAELQKAQREEEKARKEAEKLLHCIQAERKKAEYEREKARKAVEQAPKSCDGERRRRGNTTSLNPERTAELGEGGNTTRRTPPTNGSDGTTPPPAG